MAILTNISAYGAYIDAEKTKLAIEDGFDFTLTLNEDEAEKFGMDLSIGKKYSLVIRIMCAGPIDDAICVYETDTEEDDIRCPVDEEHENMVTDIVRRMRLDDIAMGVSRSDMELILRDISEGQPREDIMVLYGEDYDRYLEAYNGYVVSVYKYGRRMVEKHVKTDDNSDERWVPCITKTMADAYVREAKAMSRYYNTLDAYLLEPEEVLEERLYAISEQGIRDGKEAVRQKSEGLDIPILYEAIDVEKKPTPIDVVPKVCSRLRSELSKF